MAGTRDRITTAATELLRVTGYHGLSLKQISTGADATIGSVYHFFPGGKEELVAEVIETSAVRYVEMFELIAAAAETPLDAVTDFFAAAGEWLVSTDFIDLCPQGVVARETASSVEPLRVATANAFERLVQAGERHMQKMGLPDDVARELGVLMMVILEGAITLSRVAKTDEAMRAAQTQAVELVRRALAEQPQPNSPT